MLHLSAPLSMHFAAFVLGDWCINVHQCLKNDSLTSVAAPNDATDADDITTRALEPCDGGKAVACKPSRRVLGPVPW